jgi:hypothetical protein
MNTTANDWKHVILRVIVISGVGIIVGFIFYRYSVFIPTMRSFQFTESSITAGIAYAFLKSSTPRNLWASLFVWYVVLTGLLVEFNWWLPILNLAYISGITAAIFIYNRVMNKPFANRAILRIIFGGAITATANGFIIVALGLFSSKSVVSHFTVWLDAIKFNVEIGAVIGLAIGIGIEIAEYLNGKLTEYETELESEDEIVHKTS